jgi:hypothetical protein
MHCYYFFIAIIITGPWLILHYAHYHHHVCMHTMYIIIINIACIYTHYACKYIHALHIIRHHYYVITITHHTHITQRYVGYLAIIITIITHYTYYCIILSITLLSLSLLHYSSSLAGHQWSLILRFTHISLLHINLH